MYLVKPLSRDKGSGRYTVHLPLSPQGSVGRKGQMHCASTRPLVPREGLYQIHGQSLNTHRRKHRSGGARLKHFALIDVCSAEFFRCAFEDLHRF